MKKSSTSLPGFLHTKKKNSFLMKYYLKIEFVILFTIRNISSNKNMILKTYVTFQ